MVDQLSSVRRPEWLVDQLTCLRRGAVGSADLCEVGWLVDQLTCLIRGAVGSADLCEVGWLLDQLTCVRWGGWWTN
jgi:hypothetical protein